MALIMTRFAKMPGVLHVALRYFFTFVICRSSHDTGLNLVYLTREGCQEAMRLRHTAPSLPTCKTVLVSAIRHRASARTALSLRQTAKRASARQNSIQNDFFNFNFH